MQQFRLGTSGWRGETSVDSPSVDQCLLFLVSSRLGAGDLQLARKEISLFGSSFLLKPVFYWLFSVAGASFGLETFEPGGPNVSLDLAREPLNPRLFVPAP